jgi:cell shape-determining protein MreD
MKLLAFILLTIALFLEVSLTTIPLIFLSLLCFMVLLRKEWILIYAFIFGILLDLLSFKTMGVSSGFYVVFLFLVILYQSKFEITTGYFVFIASLVGSLICLLLAGYTDWLIVQVLASAVIGWGLFKGLQKAEVKI